MLRAGAKRIQELGVRPELEIFDTGHLWFANKLVAEGLIDDPPMYQLCMGIPYGAPPDPAPAGRDGGAGARRAWCGPRSRIGRMQMPWVAQSVLLGGHVRVGLEDNLYLGRGNKVTNAAARRERASRSSRRWAPRSPPRTRRREILALRPRRMTPCRVGRPTGCAPSPASAPGSSAAAGWRTSWPAGSPCAPGTRRRTPRRGCAASSTRRGRRSPSWGWRRARAWTA